MIDNFIITRLASHLIAIDKNNIKSSFNLSDCSLKQEKGLLFNYVLKNNQQVSNGIIINVPGLLGYKNTLDHSFKLYKLNLSKKKQPEKTIAICCGNELDEPITLLNNEKFSIADTHYKYFDSSLDKNLFDQYLLQSKKNLIYLLNIYHLVDSLLLNQ